MFLQKKVLSCILLFCCVLSVGAQKRSLAKIDTCDLKRHLTFIASDQLQGRKLGTKVDGLGITADYLADNAQKIGLLPGAKNYFQKVPVVLNKPCEHCVIHIGNEKGETEYKTNALLAISSLTESITIESKEIILVGFGDADIPDVKGKIVVLSQGSAALFKKVDLMPWNSRFERRKIETISEKHPRAIIVVTSPADRKNKTFYQVCAWFNREHYSLKPRDNSDALVLVTVPGFVDKLLGRKGAFKNYLNKIANNKITEAVAVEKKQISINIDTRSIAIDAKNVIGVVEGSDGVLKDEYVLFVAHYDHLGLNSKGEVYNGADDNGSGTVAIMEVAEAFASLPEKPKRSIVFLWLTCEEIGQLGSAYYCDNPIFPLDKTVAVINLDMVGRVYESPRDNVYKDSPKKVKSFNALYALSNDVWPELAQINEAKCKELGLVPDVSLPIDPFMQASDHYQFHKKGVPILNYSTGYHADFHQVGDKVAKINFAKIKRVSDLCFLLGYHVANVNKIEF